MTSKAILLGTATCPKDADSLHDLPAVPNSIDSVRQCFKDCSIACEKILNRTDPNKLLKKLEDVCQRTSETLVFFYAGHGLLREDNLFLCLKGTHTSHVNTTALRFGLVQELISRSPARHKVVILDCCHADLGLVQANRLEQSIFTESAYSIAAAQRGEPALSPAGQPFTMFSGELIDALRHEIGTGNEFKFTDIGARVRERMKGTNQPTVGISARGDFDRIVFRGKNARPLDRLASIDDRKFMSIIKRSIGTPRSLPPAISNRVTTCGLLCVKQIAYELKHNLAKVNDEMNVWLSRVAILEPTADLETTVITGLEKTRRLVTTLTERRELFDDWQEYGVVAKEVLATLDMFYTKCLKKTHEAKHGAINTEPNGRPNHSMETFNTVIETFQHEAGKVTEKFAHWEDASESLWNDCCDRLEKSID